MTAGWLVLIPLLTAIAVARPPTIEELLERDCPILYVPLARAIEEHIHGIGPSMYWPVVGWKDQATGITIETVSRSKAGGLLCSVIKSKAATIKWKVRTGELTPVVRVDYLALLVLCLLPAAVFVSVAILIGRNMATRKHIR